MKPYRAFTLIELMIVVVIVSILALLSYPNYQGFIMKSRRVDAEAALLGLENAMERQYTESNSYLGAGTVGGNTGAPTVFSATSPLHGSVVYYQLSIDSATATSYQLNATPTGAQSRDKCGTLTLTNIGIKAVIDADAGVVVADCW
jgi:type IV pilus assembly protein PilE